MKYNAIKKYQLLLLTYNRWNVMFEENSKLANAL